MNLFNKLKSNSVTPLFQRKSGHFVVDDNNGIALLVASSYKILQSRRIVIFEFAI